MPDIEDLEDELLKFLQQDYDNLSVEEQEQLVKLYKQKRISKSVLLIFWLFGFHYAYLRRWKVFLFYFFSFQGLLMWWVVDFFRINTILNEANEIIAKRLYSVLN